MSVPPVLRKFSQTAEGTSLLMARRPWLEQWELSHTIRCVLPHTVRRLFKR